MISYNLSRTKPLRAAMILHKARYELHAGRIGVNFHSLRSTWEQLRVIPARLNLPSPFLPNATSNTLTSSMLARRAPHSLRAQVSHVRTPHARFVHGHGEYHVCLLRLPPVHHI